MDLNSELIVSGAESASEFWNLFQLEIASIRGKLSLYSVVDPFTNVPTDAKPQQLSDIKAQLSNLEDFTVNSRLCLAAYDIRRNQEILESLKKEIKENESRTQPTRKFAFSKREPTSNNLKRNCCDHITTKDSEIKNDISLSLAIFSVCNRTDEEIYVPRAPHDNQNMIKQGTQLLIKNNQDCSILLPWVSGSVRIEGVRRCQIFLGPCETSVYLENVEESTLWISCHQLRIHNSKTCQLYVLVNSHPIIEDCSSMGFAPYLSRYYPNMNDDMKAAKLDQATCWENVVDFRWHKQTHSPNWYIIDEYNRETPSPKISNN